MPRGDVIFSSGTNSPFWQIVPQTSGPRESHKHEDEDGTRYCSFGNLSEEYSPYENENPSGEMEVSSLMNGSDDGDVPQKRTLCEDKRFDLSAKDIPIKVEPPVWDTLVFFGELESPVKRESATNSSLMFHSTV